MKKALLFLGTMLFAAATVFAVPSAQNPCNPCGKKAENPCAGKTEPAKAKKKGLFHKKDKKADNPCAGKTEPTKTKKKGHGLFHKKDK